MGEFLRETDAVRSVTRATGERGSGVGISRDSQGYRDYVSLLDREGRGTVGSAGSDEERHVDKLVQRTDGRGSLVRTARAAIASCAEDGASGADESRGISSTGEVA